MPPPTQNSLNFCGFFMRGVGGGVGGGGGEHVLQFSHPHSKISGSATVLVIYILGNINLNFQVN